MPKISNFDTSVHWALFHCFIVLSFSALAHCSPLALFCFLNNDFMTSILPYRLASLSLLLTGDPLFFKILIRVCNDVWITQPSVTQVGDSNEIVLCSCFSFWSTSPTVGNVWSPFLISPHSIFHCSSKNFYSLRHRWKKAFKLIFPRIFGYTQVKVNEEDLYLV